MEKLQQVLRKVWITDEGGYTKEIFNVDKIAFYWKKMLFRTFTGREKAIPGFKRQADSLVRG